MLRLPAALVLIVAMLAAAPVAAAPTLNCAIYTALERRCGCAGSDNYLLGYGERYCERVLHTSGWSPAGARWRDRTLACLQTALVREVAHSAHGCDCARIRTLAFDSHVQCYTLRPASVCALPLSDLRRIVEIVDAADLIDPLGAKQMLGIALSCIWQNGNAAARPDSPAR